MQPAPQNAQILGQIYQRYLENPASVDSAWATYFREFGDAFADIAREQQGPSWARKKAKLPDETEKPVKVPKGGVVPEKSAPMVALVGDEFSAAVAVKTAALIEAYRTYGHFAAKLDPLGFTAPPGHPTLSPEFHGFTAAELRQPLPVNGLMGQQTMSSDQLIGALQQTYAGPIGVEFNHISEPNQRTWLLQQLETAAAPLNAAEQKQILQELTAAESLEKTLGKKFVGAKRFGLDGSESVIAATEEILRQAVAKGTEEVVFGMAHRGRLNVLTNICHKPYRALFSEFMGVPTNPEDTGIMGDVKYHNGYSNDRVIAGKNLHVSLMPNPSHLEAVNPLVHGKTRAKQDLRSDKTRRKVLAVLMHGDAAVAGQGLVAECLQMAALRAYDNGGTIHIVINNQVGFTTNPLDARSGPYATDITKISAGPIFHVNGDQPEAVIRAARIAIAFQQEFQRDVVLDLIAYRRYGHNETDEPAFTQPKMYELIRARPTVREEYAQALLQAGAVKQEEIDAIDQAQYAKLEEEYQAAQSYRPNEADWLKGNWAGLVKAPNDARRGATALSEKDIQTIFKAISQTPKEFHVNAKIARQLEAKAEMAKTGQGIDWATAEALAFGGLLLEGNPIRFTGQDVRRGTFSHRHAVLTDQENDQTYTPLNHIVNDQKAQLEIYNSFLSEAAVLGFEYGYSNTDPNTLVLWEAQFGDFVNGAQVIIDQFIASAETKWLRLSGLVMLLPHGFEGQGPEHSSARLERFLQLCAEDNMQVANCTTPANYFHILRRQLRRNFRKPLVMMTPKSLLRHKLAVSPLAMFTGSETFHRVLHDDVRPKDGKKVKRVVLCSGKVYYDLLEARDAKGLQDEVTFLRLEQLYPFAHELLAEMLKQYPNADVVWCQEEPENQGAWHFVDRRIEAVLSEIGHTAARPQYVGRVAAASPATGYAKRHEKEQHALVEAAITAGAASSARSAKAKLKVVS